MRSRFERRAAKVSRADDGSAVLGAVTLMPPANAGGAKEWGRRIGGGVGAVVGHAMDSARQSGRDEQVPDGATMSIDGKGYFVFTTEAFLYVHAGSYKGRLVVRHPREEVRIDKQEIGTIRTPVILMRIALPDGQVLIGQMETEGYVRAISRFIESVPSGSV